MAQSEPLSVKDVGEPLSIKGVVSLILKCPCPTAQDSFIHQCRATEISGGWKNGGKPAD